MGGSIYFGFDSCVAMGSQHIAVIAEYIRPYINDISKDVMRNVYRSYDLYDSTVQFNKLTPEIYMLCYMKITEAIEDDLVAYPYFGADHGHWLIDFWSTEIKEKMQTCPLFRKELMGIRKTTEILAELNHGADPMLLEEIRDSVIVR